MVTFARRTMLHYLRKRMEPSLFLSLAFEDMSMEAQQKEFDEVWPMVEKMSDEKLFELLKIGPSDGWPEEEE